VAVTSTSPEPLRFLYGNFGGLIKSKARREAHHKPAQEWVLRGDAALTFLSCVLPYMRELRKVKRAELLLSGYKAVTPRNGKYTDLMAMQRKQFEDRFFAL